MSATTPARRRPRDPRVIAGVLAVGAVYLLTRLIFIGKFPYFVDEGLYAGWARDASHSLHDLFIAESISREPLLTWAALPLVKLGFHPLTAMRLVSVLSGLLTIPVVALLGRRLGGAAVAWVAAGLCVVLPFLVVHDGIGIYEPLVTLIMATALLLQIQLAEDPRVRTGVLLGLVMLAALLTKQNTLPALILLPASLLLFDWRPEGRTDRLKRWGAGLALAVLGAVGAKLVLRISSYYPTYVALRKSPLYTVRSFSQVFHHPFDVFAKEAWHVFRVSMTGYVTWPLLGATLAGAVLAIRRELRLALLLLIWIAVPFVGALLFTTFPFPRHVLYVLPPMIVLMAFALVRAGVWLRARMPSPAAGVAACAVGGLLVLAPALVFDGKVLADPGRAHYPTLDEWQYVVGTPAGGAWRGLVGAIKRHPGPGPGPTVVVAVHADPEIPSLLLQGDHRFVVVRSGSPLAAHARLAYEDDTFVFPDPAGLALVRHGGFDPIGRFRRFRPCGPAHPLFIAGCPKGTFPPVILYERSPAG